jgi:hypothetical protein
MSSDFLIAGDEIVYGGLDGNGLRAKAWVVNVQGNHFQLIDKDGTVITTASGGFTVIRSGHRNLQTAGIMNVTLMRNPLKNVNGTDMTNLGTGFLSGSSWDTWKIINVGAVDYSDYWPTACECGMAPATAGINPYFRNERGVWRAKSSRTYLTGRNFQAEITPRREGFFNKFEPFYKLTSTRNWYRNTTDWTFVAEVSQYSPYGFKLESRDALNRYSGQQYGYNNMLQIAVGNNARYREIGYDGFEDHIGFAGCTDSHFTFRGVSGGTAVSSTSHSGKYSMKVNGGSSATLNKKIACPSPAQP